MKNVAAICQERRNIADLKPAEYNPRKSLQPGDPEYESLKRSIETFGYVDPIIVNKDGTVIGGHQRLSVLVNLGYTEADVAAASPAMQGLMEDSALVIIDFDRAIANGYVNLSKTVEAIIEGGKSNV